MSRQIPRQMGPVALLAALLVWSIGFGAPPTTARADDCLAQPNSPAPAGSHWYYHVDKATQRKCWHVGATDQPVEAVAAQAASNSARVPAAPPPEEPATASGPTSINASDSTTPSPRIKAPVKPHAPSVSGAATGQSARQSAQKVTPQTLTIQAHVPQASPSSQTSDHGATTESVPTPAWPDPPTISRPQEPAATPNDIRAEFSQPTAGTSTSDTKSVTDDAISTATAGTTTSALTKPIAIFGVVALVLVVAGILLRVVMKIFTAGRRPITTDEYDFDDFDRIGDLAHELHEDQVVDDALSDYLKRPKIPTESDSKRRRPSQIGADRVDVTRAGDSAFHITDTISMRKHTRIDVKPCGSEPSDAEPQRESVSIDPKPDSIDDRNHYQERNARRQHGPVSETDAFRITDKISMRKHTRIDVKPRRSESSDADPQRESVSIDLKPSSIEDRHHYQERNARRQHGPVSETDAFRITDKISMRKHTRIDGKPSRSESSEADPQRESVSIDPKPDSIEDRHHYQERNGRRQHGSVTETEEFLRDLQSSLIGAASASPLQADAVGSSDRRGKDGPSHIGDEIREREDVLEQLRRDLDRLLQSPKVA